MFQERMWKIFDSYHLICKQELLICIRSLDLSWKIFKKLEIKWSNNLFNIHYQKIWKHNMTHAFIVNYYSNSSK